VIPQTGPQPRVRPKLGDFVETFLKRIPLPSDEIAGQKRKLRTQVIGHPDNAPQILTVQVGAIVNVADLNDS
jgi:hypothetical protein